MATIDHLPYSYLENWILNVGQIVPLSESHSESVHEFLYFRFQVSMILNTYYGIAMFNVCVKRCSEIT